MILVTLEYIEGYVHTDVHDVMAIKPSFLASMGYHIFLTMVLRAACPELHYQEDNALNAALTWEMIKFKVREHAMMSAKTKQTNMSRIEELEKTINWP